MRCVLWEVKAEKPSLWGAQGKRDHVRRERDKLALAPKSRYDVWVHLASLFCGELTMYRLLWAFWGAALLFFLPSEAWAFGPITHIRLGTQVLQQLHLIPPLIAHLLQQFPQAYLYGNMAADVIMAKNLAKQERHCHNWDIGFSVLEAAKRPEERSFAWGYLSHLAADTIAHNYFVPWKLTEDFLSRTRGHAYWELRLDQRAPSDVWQQARDVSKQKFHGPKQLLSRTIQGTLFRFETNLVIFQGMLFVQRLEQWQKLLDRIDRKKSLLLPSEQALEQMKLANAAIISLLQHQRQSPVCASDPTGIPNLKMAQKMRKSLRKAHRKKILSSELTQQTMLPLRLAFQQSLVSPFVFPQEIPEELLAFFPYVSGSA